MKETQNCATCLWWTQTQANRKNNEGTCGALARKDVVYTSKPEDMCIVEMWVSAKEMVAAL